MQRRLDLGVDAQQHLEQLRSTVRPRACLRRRRLAQPCAYKCSTSLARPAARFSSTSAARPAACCCERSPPLRSRSPFSPPSRLRLRSPLWPASARVDGTRALRVGLACASALRLRVRTYREISIRNETAHLCDFQLVDLTHDFDTRHAVTLPPGSVLNRSSWQRRLGGSSTSGLSISDGKAA